MLTGFTTKLIGARRARHGTRLPGLRSWPGRGSRWLVLSIGVALCSLAAPGGASASFLIYQCGSAFQNLCRINPDGTGKQQLTHDGIGESTYSSPSLSRNGTRLAFLKGGAVFSADAKAQTRHMLASGSAVETHISPDGTRVMGVMESGDLYGNLQIEAWTFPGSAISNDAYYPTLTGGWGPGDVEISGCQDQHRNMLAYSMCVLTGTPKQSGQVVALARNTSATKLFLPTVSPNGSTVAVEQLTNTGSGYPSTIALYKYSTGAFIKNLTKGTSDQAPTWSPDGKWIAFQRGTEILKIPATGGTPHVIVSSGKDPTWG